MKDDRGQRMSVANQARPARHDWAEGEAGEGSVEAKQDLPCPGASEDEKPISPSGEMGFLCITNDS